MRQYRVIISKTEGGLDQVAKSGNWTILQSTVREFAGLDSNDDNSLGNIGGIVVDQKGFVALAFKET